MEYKIVGFNRYSGELYIEYPNNVVKTLMMIPDTNGNVLVGDELDAFIIANAPVEIKNALQILDLVQSNIASQDPIENVSLESAKNIAKSNIDSTVGIIRQRYLTYITGQELVYKIKSEQAFAYKESNYQGAVPSYIAAEASATGRTPQEVTDAVIYVYNSIDQLSSQLEAARIAGKQLIDAAPTNTDVGISMQNTITAIYTIADTTN